MAMSKAEAEECYTSGKLNRMYDDYHAGNISRDDWIIFLVDLLENYLKQQIKLKHRTMGAEFEDLMQQGKLAIVAHADEYDPHKGRATSFFIDYFNQYTREALVNEGMTNYFVSAVAKMEKAAKIYGYEGCTDPRLDAATLSVLTDLPLKTVIEALKMKSRQFVSLEWDCGDGDNDIEDISFKNPEDACIDNEVQEIVREQLKRLSPLELFLLDNTVLADNPKSYRCLVELLKKQEYFEKFSDELPKTLTKINQVFLEQKTNSALRKLKYSAPIRKLVYIHNDDVEIEEQASMEDIEAAFGFGVMAM